MATLPERPNLDQLRRQAKELRDAAARGNQRAVNRLLRFSERPTLAAAQLAIARKYGFASWARLKTEVLRKQLIEAGDLDGLRALLRGHPALAREPVSSALSARASSALEYVAVARFHGAMDADVSGELTQVLLEAGAQPDGEHGAADRPLITAASYGELDMVRALIAAGADLDSVSASLPDGGTALAHAVYYGMPAVVDVLIAAGAAVRGIEQHAGAGRVAADMVRTADRTALAAALRAAVVCARAETIDQLLDGGADVNAKVDGATALHWAAWQAKADSIEHLLGRGADPTVRDDRHDCTAGQWYRFRRDQLAAVGNPHRDRDGDRIERLLP